MNAVAEIDENTAAGSQGRPPETPGGGQAREGLGVWRIASVVIAFSAPLAVVAGFLAVVIAFGNGLGAPVAFLAMGAVLLVFALGYTELVKALPESGGFYVYITAGLGRPMGLAGTLIALLSYFLLAAGTYAFFGLTASRFLADYVGGPLIPWWAFAAAAWLLSTFLSFRELSLSAKVLGVTIILEFALMLTFDGSVLFRGGPEGFSSAPFTLSALLSGSPGIAALFAAGQFLGFESTAIYRDEAREPTKTIPRATFLTVTFMTIFYAATTYMLITALGASHAVSIAAADPSKAFAVALDRELGRVATTAGYLLLCTSLYGAVLSMHNVLARYVFKLASKRLISTRLASIHPKYNAPSVASLASALVLALFIAPFAVLGTDPALLYARLVGVGAFGIITLLFLTAVAVILYFRRCEQKVDPIRSFWAPMIAAACLFAVFVLANLNFIDLTGTSPARAHVVQGAIYVTVAAGIVWALWLRAHRPGVYAQIGAG